MDAILSLTLRDWMVIVGSLLILAVIIDALRRMQQERRSRVRVKLVTDGGAAEADDISMLRELPNGGARVLKREDLLAAREQFEAEQDSEVGGSGETGDRGEKNTADTPAPRSPAPRAARRAPREESRDEPLAGVRPDRGEPANLDWLEDLPRQSDTHADDESAELPRSIDPEVIILHVIATDEAGFDGKAILEILLACDLRFGDMNFFHRHEREAGRGPIQFSVANMLQPGVFDIDNMSAMRTRGLVFFVTLPGPEDMAKAFDYMLETARTVARNLGGQVLDESRSALTEQAVEHARLRIRELERRLLAQSR